MRDLWWCGFELGGCWFRMRRTVCLHLRAGFGLRTATFPLVSVQYVVANRPALRFGSNLAGSVFRKLLHLRWPGLFRSAGTRAIVRPYHAIFSLCFRRKPKLRGSRDIFGFCGSYKRKIFLPTTTSLSVAKQRLKSVIHVLLYVAMKQRQSQLIGDQIGGYAAVQRHDDGVLHQSRRRLSVYIDKLE